MHVHVHVNACSVHVHACECGSVHVFYKTLAVAISAMQPVHTDTQQQALCKVCNANLVLEL